MAIILRPFAVAAIFLFGLELGLMTGATLQGCRFTGPVPPQFQHQIASW